MGDTDGQEQWEDLALEVVLVLRGDDPPWAVLRVGVIGASGRSDPPPPAPRAPFRKRVCKDGHSVKCNRLPMLVPQHSSNLLHHRIRLLLNLNLTE